MLRFRVLGASFSRFGCFVLRSSFSSASFSKLPSFSVVFMCLISPTQKFILGKNVQITKNEVSQDLMRF